MSQDTTVAPPGEDGISFVSEGVQLQVISDSRWELHVFFSVLNSSPRPAFVYDIHAEEYLQQTEGLQGNMSYLRPYISLYQDNSILRDGKVYEVPPHGLLPVKLGLRISRSREPGPMLYVFGLFIDYHCSSAGGQRKRRKPSDALYAFQNPDAQFLMIDQAWESKASSPEYRKGSLRKILAILGQHSARSQDL
jgi:hypothetical protein